MSGRIVVFGATGYTGRLVAEALVARGERPVLAGRGAPRLDELAQRLGGGLATQVADVAQPASVRDLVGPGDVLVSTVGPFERFGRPALEAAVDAGAHYLDSTGEQPFIRRVFEQVGPRAAERGVALFTGFGYDYVPGNLAGALALREAGPDATAVDVGYFLTGPARMSTGTRASAMGIALADHYAFRDGRLVDEPPMRHVRAFGVQGRSRLAGSVGGTEQLALPRVAPGLREVGVYLGWFGPATLALQAFSRTAGRVVRSPAVRPLAERALGARLPRTGGGPDAEARSRNGSWVVAEARDAGGRLLATVTVAGVDAYDFTGRVLAWGAGRLARGEVRGSGALGPVDGFGLDALVEGCREAGLAAV